MALAGLIHIAWGLRSYLPSTQLGTVNGAKEGASAVTVTAVARKQGRSNAVCTYLLFFLARLRLDLRTPLARSRLDLRPLTYHLFQEVQSSNI